MGSKPKMPPATPPSPTPPSLASSFLGKNRGLTSRSMLGGTYLTADAQPLVRKEGKRKTLLGA